jgi:hypothetical protein
MIGLLAQKVSLHHAHSGQNGCEEDEPKGIDSQLPLSIFLLTCIRGIGWLGAYLYDHGRRFWLVLIVVLALGLWICRASTLIFGCSFACLTGYTCRDCGNCEYHQPLSHDGGTLPQRISTAREAL